MYVRIAQFAAADDNWDDRIAEVRKRMQGGSGGDGPDIGPAIARSLMLVDRENRQGASVFFCETEDDLRKVDEFMNNAQPPGDDKRLSVQKYEVALDSETVQ